MLRSGAAILAVAFLVMMEAAKASHEDLKAIMGNVKRIDEAKASLRQRAPKPSGTAVARSSSPAAATAMPRTSLPPTQAVVSPRPLPKAEFDRNFDRAKTDLDSMSEMGEMESLRLQMAMDRMSKLMSTLSNLLKKMSDTAAGITKKLK